MKHAAATPDVLQSPVRDLKGIGPAREILLKKLGIENIEDALRYFPFRYEDRSQVMPVIDCRPGLKVTLEGEVKKASLLLAKRGFKIFSASIRDTSGEIQAVWFNQPYLKNVIERGLQIRIFGKVTAGKTAAHRVQLLNPDFEILRDQAGDSLHMGRIIPVYPATEGLGTRRLRQLITTALDHCRAKVRGLIPEPVRRKHRLLHREAALRKIHFPAPATPLDQLNRFRSRAHETLIFEEFLVDQLTHLARRKKFRNSARGPVLKAGAAFRKDFLKRLPFRLTDAQKRVMEEIIRDVACPIPMNRILQGDVGSGKTVIALLAMVITLAAGYQAALMAPTEVLAEQHAMTLKRFLGDGYPIFLLTGSTDPAGRREIKERLSDGMPAIFVGTHALIQKKIRFSDLGMTVIDEQHKFGVRQRIRLVKKGRSPHVLTMTATPIPRSLTLTLYGDLDCSVIDEMPPGRLAVKTVIRNDRDRPRIYQFIKRLVREGDQVFFVCPLVESSEKMDLKAAVTLHEELQASWFPGIPIALMHGRMKGEEKEAVMRAFAGHEIQIMVATTVIEVGIDLPDARLVVIEDAERFGLSQLHQLRGRVGRGAKQSYCILMQSRKCTPEAEERLKIMTETNNGFLVAEKDLHMRGSGDLQGTRQSGEPFFRIGHPLRDIRLLNLAREEAKRILREDPALSMPAHRTLYEIGQRRWKSLFS